MKRSFRAHLGALFMGAYNDNLLRFGSVIFFLAWIEDPIARNNFISLSAAVFGIPFLLFSLQAGRIADRWEKRKVVFWVKAFEFIPVFLTGIGAGLQNPIIILAALFFISLQSAFFGPVKFSLLPELFEDRDLPRANAWLNVFTFLAILFGSVTAALISERTFHLVALMSGVFIIGLLCASFVKSPPAARPDMSLHLNPIPDFLENWREADKAPLLLRSFFASSYFWFAGAVIQINTFVYVKEILHASNQVAAVILTLAVGGICLGSGAASAFLKGRISLRSTSWALGGLGLALFDLFLFGDTPGRAMADAVALGFFSGFYIVPLEAFIQARSTAKHKGGLMGMMNLLNFAGILGASVFLFATGSVFQTNSAGVFGSLGALTLLTAFILPFVLKERP